MSTTPAAKRSSWTAPYMDEAKNMRAHYKSIHGQDLSVINLCAELKRYNACKELALKECRLAKRSPLEWIEIAKEMVEDGRCKAVKTIQEIKDQSEGAAAASPRTVRKRAPAPAQQESEQEREVAQFKSPDTPAIRSKLHKQLMEEQKVITKETVAKLKKMQIQQAPEKARKDAEKARRTGVQAMQGEERTGVQAMQGEERGELQKYEGKFRRLARAKQIQNQPRDTGLFQDEE